MRDMEKASDTLAGGENPWNILDLTRPYENMHPECLDDKSLRFADEIRKVLDGSATGHRQYEKGYGWRLIGKWGLLTKAGAVTLVRQDIYGFWTWSVDSEVPSNILALFLSECGPEMPGRKIHELVEGKGTWRYPGSLDSFTLGALRLIQVKPLLSKKNSRLLLYEFPALALQGAEGGNIPSYAAVSHVWQPSPAVARRENTRPLYITVEEDGTHEISWLGLMQTAIAARHLKCDYIWLDFVCLNQTSKADKRLQIKNMANIYAYCSATIVMFGGVRCAQRLDDESFWHTRAWTLQEAVESVKRGRNAVRYALVEWPYDKSYEVFRRGFQKLEGGLAIVPIRELLDLHGNPMPMAQTKKVRKYGPPSYGETILLPVHCFSNTAEVIKSLLLLLYHPMELGKHTVMDSSIWRALWVRTSSREHDVLYSSMGLFSTPVHLDINYNKEFESVLIDFVAALHEKSSVPHWLGIGHRIPVYGWSGLLPKRPEFKRHTVPTYVVGGSKEIDATEFLCDGGCCSALDLCVEITGASKEAGHTLCAKVLNVVRVAKTETLSVYTGRCWQHVRKILLSYIPEGSGAAAGSENWTFETDADAVVEEVDTYSRFDKETAVLNRYDGSTGKPVVPQYNKQEAWIRSRTEGADLAPLQYHSPESVSVDVTALCWLDGRVGPYLVIVGFFNTHYQNPVVYFIDRTKDGNIQRVGTGKLLLAERDRIKSDIPWRHLRVGGSGGADPVFGNCVCEEKEDVPLIELEQDEWWSDTW
ncbi:MAG: hypothetical protein M1839_006694 [Geoglossum umbratile]|nr:MAG: hypothetical protein M1839_006694 [Geoglossum umbratile]